MEIGPITGIRALPIKTPSPVLGLPAVFDIENYVRIHDESYSPSDARSGNDLEDDPDELEEFDELVEYDASQEDNEAALSVYAARVDPVHHLSFFA